jgi:type 1 glutamine amidotransferase
MRPMLKSIVLLLALSMMPTTLFAQAPAQAEDDAQYDQSAVPLEQDVLPGAPKIVLIAGRKSHGPGDHEFFAGTAILQKMLKQNGVNAVMARDGWPKNESIFDGAKAVMMYMDGGGGHPLLAKAERNRLQRMKSMLAEGAGFACLHYAVEYPKESANDVLPMLGGYFEPFWSVNPHWDAHFKTLPQHPITRGVKPFKIRDEWYYHMKFVDGMKGVTPILTDIPPDATRGKPGTNDAHGGNPEVQKHMGEPEHVAWAYERSDGGRSFGFTGAHFHRNWADENFRRLVVNALMWTAKVEIPETGANVEMDPADMKKYLDDKRRPKAPAAPAAQPKAAASPSN